MRRLVVAVVLCVASRDAAAGFDLTFQADPHAGIHRETWVDTAIPAKLRLVRVDLSSQEITLYATDPAHAGATTTAYASTIGAAIAINGDAFTVASFQPRGLAMGAPSGGAPVVWAGTADDGYSGYLDFSLVPNDNGGTHTFAEISPPEEVRGASSLPPATQGVVSGRPLLVRAGVIVTQYDCNDALTIPCERAPRTAVAVSADGNTLWVAVVDGWQSASAGLTDEELAVFLQAHGADTALALDPASSSTLVVDGAMVSSPSDGVERAVANHLGIVWGAQQTGHLLGVICEGTISPCNAIAGATVTLDDGQSQQTNINGVFDFAGITPRFVCATASATGFCPLTRCVYVSSGAMNYDSMGLAPRPAGGCPAPPADASIDAFVIPADGEAVGDGGGRDAGHGLTGGGGGCCGAGTGRPDLLVWALVAWFLVRRRGTTADGP